MSTPSIPGSSPQLVLRAATAADLMRTDLVSLRSTATIPEAIATLTQKGLNACPVVDAAGQPVGVLSKADILVHERERPRPGHTPTATDPALVRDLMTPAVFSATPQTSAAAVVQQMVELKVQQLFVVDRSRVLIGVITALDVLQNLKP